MDFISQIKSINSVDGAVELLLSFKDTDNIKKAVEFCIEAHKEQKRKSGEPYAVHPILVASIVASYGGDEPMIIAGLLHDVVEDTDYTIEDVKAMFGMDVDILVEGLTKIVEIRDEKLPSSSSNEKLIASALSFRKMLVASIKDIRVLVIKLCDRMHNMLTLNALPANKQIRIAEETLVVYAPIAHRLGISSIKNILEDISFYYLFPTEYKKIDDYFESHEQKIQLLFNSFISKVVELLQKNGYNDNNFKILNRVKHNYSIFLKMQRKGISIEEVLDLLAIRILLKTQLDCYIVLGIIHLHFKPLIARFKDYISLPKENGYQTLHTTIFDDSFIFEVQIRTFEMHHSAEYGVAAHWKYKNGGLGPNLDWLNNLQYQDESIEGFYELAKNDLLSEDIVVYSPKGDIYRVPKGSVALDFAYQVHSNIGKCAKEAIINKMKKPLLTELRDGDIINIVTSQSEIVRCSWIDAVKTSRAKNLIRVACNHRLREIDKMSCLNLFKTIFDRDIKEVEIALKLHKLDNNCYKSVKDISLLKDIKLKIKDDLNRQKRLFQRLKPNQYKLKEMKFDNIIIYTNQSISEIVFDYCCHPKFGDLIVAFRVGQKAYIHHKLCDKAYEMIENGSDMVYVEWSKNRLHRYKLVVSLENKKGALATFLQILSKLNINILTVQFSEGDEGFIKYCNIEIESDMSDTKWLRDSISKKVKLIELIDLNDAYKSNS